MGNPLDWGATIPYCITDMSAAGILADFMSESKANKASKKPPHQKKISYHQSLKSAAFQRNLVSNRHIDHLPLVRIFAKRTRKYLVRGSINKMERFPEFLWNPVKVQLINKRLSKILHYFGKNAFNNNNTGQKLILKGALEMQKKCENGMTSNSFEITNEKSQKLLKVTVTSLQWQKGVRAEKVK